MKNALCLSALLLALLATAALAGRSKMIELKSMPKTAKTLADALYKEKKDANKKAVLSLALDELLRAQPEVQDPNVYDQLTHLLLNDVFDKMAEPTDAFSTEYGPDKFAPRADLLIRESAKIKPGRVGKSFRRQYMKKLQGKKIDRAYREQFQRPEIVTAGSDDEFQAWTDAKGWGIVMHAANLDTSAGVARIGCTFISPGTPENPGGRFERPSWVAFYWQAKPGVGPFSLLSIAPVTASDWREQPINLIPAKVEPNESARKLALAVWMEQVRALPVREKFTAHEQAIFDLQMDGEAPPQAWVEAYRDSDSAMVRAAATAKVVSMGGELNPNSTYLISRSLRSVAARNKMEELLKKAPAGWKPPPLPANFRDEVALAAAADAGTKSPDAGVKADGGK